MLDVCEQWPLVLHDFAATYGIRLASAGLSWREFVAYLAGLLADRSSLLWQHFHPTDREDVPVRGADDGGW